MLFTYGAKFCVTLNQAIMKAVKIVTWPEAFWGIFSLFFLQPRKWWWTRWWLKPPSGQVVLTWLYCVQLYLIALCLYVVTVVSSLAWLSEKTRHFHVWSAQILRYDDIKNTMGTGQTVSWTEPRSELLTGLWECHLSELMMALHVQESTKKRCHEWIC